jgi:putative ABC transport system permease protein
MRSVDKLRLRLRSLFRRPRVEAELAAELAFHLDQLTAENVAAGMSSREARHAALRAFGGVDQIEERCREVRGTKLIEDLWRDLEYAVRTFRRSPLFTLVAVLSLALGIGANTAIFSLITALLLRPLPVRQPDRLVAVGNPVRSSSLSEGTIRGDLFSYPMYRQIRDHNHVFSGVYASGRTGALRVRPAGAAADFERVRGRLVSGNFFSVLGVQAVRGRTFAAEDDRAPGLSPVVVVSHDFWVHRLSGDPAVLGRVLTINHSPFTVIGVMPPGFSGDVVGLPTEIWIPVMMQQQANPGRAFLDRWDENWLLLMGRLRPGASLAQARADVDGVYRQVLAEAPRLGIAQDILPEPDTPRTQVGPGGTGFSWLRRQFAQPLVMVMGLVALVLLIACANVAGLLLERSMGRRQEIAVRLSLGASRARLIRQLLTESVLLSCSGAALGMLFSLWAGPALLRLAGGSTPIALELRLDVRIFAFTGAIAVLTGILFGIIPALRATRIGLAPTLKENARSVAGASGRWRLGRVLVVAQFVLSLLLLTGAGLFAGSLRNLQKLALGFDRDHLLLMSVDPVAAGLTGDRLRAFPLQLMEHLRAVPGIDAVSLSENGVFSGTENATEARVEGFTPAQGQTDLNYDHVGPDYFATLGTRIVAGRGLGAQDRNGAPLVAVVNEAMARQCFAGRSPLGRHIKVGEQDFEIVGLAADARDHDVREAAPPRFFTSLLQAADVGSTYNFEIRSRQPAAIAEAVRQAVRAFNPELPVNEVRPLAAMISDSLNHERLLAQLAVAFGVLALLLASIGLYGVISYTISRRTNEIGIRMALGAARPAILRMVLRETLLLVLAGVTIGVPAALAGGRLIAAYLFGLSARDPLTLAAATGVLLVVALFAGAVPGTRATQVDPTEALRYG